MLAEDIRRNHGISQDYCNTTVVKTMRATDVENPVVYKSLSQCYKKVSVFDKTF